MKYVNMEQHTAQFKKLRRRIMRRVYRAYALRTLMSPIVTHSTVIMVAFIALTRSVSLPHVIQNAQHMRGEWYTLDFFLRAFMHTELFNYLLLAVIIFACYSLFLRPQSRSFNLGQQAFTS